MSVPIVLAQADSAQELPEFVLEPDAALHKNSELPAVNAHLAGLFQQTVLSDVRSAGPGILSPLSFRGGSSAQTTVQWNGIPLESPTNSICDLSLIPVYFFDELGVGSGNSALSGPGAISGSVWLKSRFREEQGARFGLGLGSFGNQHLNADWNTRKKGFRNRSRVFALREQNNFPYEGFRGEKMRQNHSARDAWGVMQQNSWQKKNLILRSSVWWQEFHREIPPTMLEGRSTKVQVDRNLRSSLNLAYKRKKNSIRGNFGYAREYLRYSDSLSGIDETYYSDFALAQFHFRRQLSDQWAAFGFLENRYARAEASSYYTNTRNEFSPASHLSWNGNTGSATFSIRKSYYLTLQSPLLYALEFSQKMGSHRTILSFSKNYRLPSMNDLFWSPGGNPELEPELSYRGELIYSFQWRKTRLSCTIFNHNIREQIRWIPSSGGWYQAVQSNTPTWNRGLETILTRTDSFGPWQFQSTIQMQYLRSTTLETGISWFGGIQQIFVPEYQGTAEIRATWRHSIQSTLGFRYLGNRFLLDDHSKELPAFGILHASVSYRFHRNWQGTLILGNITNQSYSILEYRPMPGFNIQCSINYTIHPNKSS